MKLANSGGSLIGRIGSYLQIVAKDPSSTAFVPLAEAYRQVGLLDDALEVARLGTQRLPHFSPGFSTVGRILGQMGRIDEAMSAYATALDMDHESQSALVGLARLHLIRGDRDKARTILQQAAGFHPDDEKIADMLIALDLPRPWQQITQASLSREAVPQEEPPPVEAGEPILTATLAEIYVKQGLLDKAVKVYKDILRQNPGNSAARERLLQLHEQAVGKVDVPPFTGAEQRAPVVEQVVDVAEGVPVKVAAVKDQSPLGVFQRWLTAIKQGRANV